MILRKASLATRMFVLTLALFALCTAGLFATQHRLYVRSFEKTLGSIQDSSLTVKRESANGMMQSVRAATQRMLQTGEYKQFVEFAERQRQVGEVQEMSFAGRDGKVQYASPGELVGAATVCRAAGAARGTDGPVRPGLFLASPWSP